MDDKKSPSDNYTALAKLRREVHQSSTEIVFSDNFMWRTFVAGLIPREQFINIAEGFPSAMQVLDKLTRLDEKWETLRKPAKAKERAFQASVEDNSDDRVGAAVEHALAAMGLRSRPRSSGRTLCYKCGSDRHVSIACKYAEDGFAAAKAARIHTKGEESDEDRKVYVYEPPTPNQLRSRPPSGSSRPSYREYRRDRFPSRTPSPERRSEKSTNWRQRSQDKPSSHRPNSQIVVTRNKPRWLMGRPMMTTIKVIPLLVACHGRSGVRYPLLTGPLILAVPLQ